MAQAVAENVELLWSVVTKAKLGRTLNLFQERIPSASWLQSPGSVLAPNRAVPSAPPRCQDRASLGDGPRMRVQKATASCANVECTGPSLSNRPLANRAICRQNRARSVSQSVCRPSRVSGRPRGLADCSFICKTGSPLNDQQNSSLILRLIISA